MKLSFIGTVTELNKILALSDEDFEAWLAAEHKRIDETPIFGIHKEELFNFNSKPMTNKEMLDNLNSHRLRPEKMFFDEEQLRHLRTHGF